MLKNDEVGGHKEFERIQVATILYFSRWMKILNPAIIIRERHARFTATVKFDPR